jgi:hypothetical protein
MRPKHHGSLGRIVKRRTNAHAVWPTPRPTRRDLTILLLMLRDQLDVLAAQVEALGEQVTATERQFARPLVSQQQCAPTDGESRASGPERPCGASLSHENRAPA